MPTFRILPAHADADLGWIVEATHESGVIETSVVLASRENAQAAADSWAHLDEDRAAI